MKHKLNTDRMRDISNHDAIKLQRVLNVDRTTPKRITLYYKVQMYNYIKLLYALNKVFQLGNNL